MFSATVSKGISANLMKKTAKRRRSKIELKEAREREAYEKALLSEKLAEVADLKQQISGMNNNLAQASDLHQQVQNLVNEGIIKQADDGRLVEVDDQQERESIQIATGSKRKTGGVGIGGDRRQAQLFGPS